MGREKSIVTCMQMWKIQSSNVSNYANNKYSSLFFFLLKAAALSGGRIFVGKRYDFIDILIKQILMVVIRVNWI